MTLVKLLEWDTKFWGVRTARLELTTSSELHSAESLCAELQIRWASLLVPIGNTGLLNAAIRQKFEIVDIRHTLRLDPIDRRVDDAEVTLAGAADADSLAEIAATAFPRSRFAADSHLSNARCADFYATWAHNSLNGKMANGVVIDRRTSRGPVNGFITIRLNNDGTAGLPLVAVRESERGTGVGRRLLAQTLRWISAHGSSSVDVVTQLSNTPAIRLYEGAGFRTTESAVWLHRWF